MPFNTADYFVARVLIMYKEWSTRVVPLNGALKNVTTIEFTVRMVDANHSIIRSLPEFVVWSFGRQAKANENFVIVNNVYTVQFHKSTFNIAEIRKAE